MRRFICIVTAGILILTGFDLIWAAQVTLPGTTNIWLAGMPDGTDAYYGDVAPTYSPVLVQDVKFTSCSFIEISDVTGEVNNCPWGPGFGADGNPDDIQAHAYGAQFFKSDIVAPLNSIICVFLNDNEPSEAAPDRLDFSTSESRDYLELHPLLQQVFFIGDGLTSTGVKQKIFVPSGATRLFVATMDSYQSSSNWGFFTFQVMVMTSAEPVPYETKHFSITYYTSGTDAVDLTDSDANCIPDFVQKIGDMFEMARHTIHEQWKFNAPSSTNFDSKYNVIIKDLGNAVFGNTQDFGGCWTNINCRLSDNRRPSDTDLNGNGMMDDGMLLYICSHEYFHGCQYATIPQDILVFSVEPSMREGSANAIGYITYMQYFDTVNHPDADLYNELQFLGFLGGPENALFSNYGNGYPACLYWYFLYTTYGQDTIKNIWNTLKYQNYSFPHTISYVLSAYETDMDSSFKLFSENNYFQYPTTTSISSVSFFPYNSGIRNIGKYASAYYRIDNFSGPVKICFEPSGFTSNFFVRVYPNNTSNTKLVLSTKSIIVCGSNTSVIINRLDDAFGSGNYSLSFSIEPQVKILTSLLYPAQSRALNTTIDSTITNTKFYLSWIDSDLDFTLVDPNGMVIDPNYIANHPEITYSKTETEAYYLIDNPTPGQWQMQVTAVDVPPEGEPYTATTYLTTDLNLLFSTDKQNYEPLEPVNLTAKLIYDANSYPGPEVTARIERSDANEIITLYDDGLHNDANSADGIYANTYFNTSVEGQYNIVVNATGINPFDEPFVRETSNTVQVKCLPDLVPADLDTMDELRQGQIILTATIRNNGTANQDNIEVAFYDVTDISVTRIDPNIVIDHLEPNEFETVSIEWDAAYGRHRIYVVADPNNTILEKVETNNYTERSFGIMCRLETDLDEDLFVGPEDLILFVQYWLNTCSANEWCDGRDFNKDAKVDSSDYAILAKEFSCLCHPFDFNLDGVMNLTDFVVLAGKWLDTCSAPTWCDNADIDQSGQVDGEELMIFAEHWIEGL